MKTRMQFNSYYLLLATCYLLLASCNNEKKTIEEKVAPAEFKASAIAHITPPDFNADSSFVYIKAQADMGPREPGSKAHEQAVNYFEKKFKEYGAEVIIQKATVTTFDQKKWLSKNIIASFNPKNTKRVMLSAHWDSRPFCDRDSTIANQKKACPGVNDGASGAGVLIEIARELAKQKINIGVDIILWDMEDYGQGSVESNTPPMDDDWALGSQYWSQNPHKPGYTARYGILLDMVGAKNTNFPMEQFSVLYAKPVVAKIWDAATNLGYGNYFVPKQIGEITDDHVYVNKFASIPTVDIIGYTPNSGGFFRYHHCLQDDINSIDKNTLKAVGQTVLEVIYNEQP
jgi:glutaminyl-peptide cyclotransferase